MDPLCETLCALWANAHSMELTLPFVDNNSPVENTLLLESTLPYGAHPPIWSTSQPCGVYISPVESYPTTMEHIPLLWNTSPHYG